MIPDTILLIPAPGSTLLDDPCAPSLFKYAEHWESPVPGKRNPYGSVAALILARSSKAQRHGCLALAEGIPIMDFSGAFSDVRYCVRQVLRGHHGALQALIAAHWPGARLIFLDSDGADVAMTPTEHGASPAGL